MARSVWKGPFVHPSLLKKVEKGGDALKRPIKTWSRGSTIVPEFVGLKFEIHNGKKFTIKSDDNNYNSHYIKSLKLNGADYNNTWIGYDEIKKGGNLIFKMDNKPNKDFGVSNLSRPFSLSDK